MPRDQGINRAYDKCQSQIIKLRSYLQQKRSDDPELLKTVSNINETLSSPSKQIPNLQCSATMQCHVGKIQALQWFPNGNEIVSSAQDGKLIVSNANSARSLFAISLKSAWVMTCTVSPCGGYVASGGLDTVMTVFDVSDGWKYDDCDTNIIKQVEILQHEAYIAGIQYIDNNRILSVSGDATAKIYDLHTQKCLKIFSYPGDIESVHINPQKSIFITGCVDAAVYLDDYRTKSSSQHVGKFVGHQFEINAVRWFPDNISFVSGSDDSSVRLFDMRSFQQMNIYQVHSIYSRVTSVDCSQSGYCVFAAYDDGYCASWNSLTGRRQQELLHPHHVSCLQMSPSGRTIATGCWDTNVRFWSTSPPSSVLNCYESMTTCDKCICL